MYDQTSAGRDRGADVGATSYGPTSSSPTTADSEAGTAADIDPTATTAGLSPGTPGGA